MARADRVDWAVTGRSPSSPARPIRSSRRRCAQILGVELSPHPDDPVQQRLPAGAAAGQLPAARRLHRAVAGPAGAGEPVRAAADAGRRARRLGRPHHRGDPALRVRPVGQEGRAADLHRRPAGRRHAGHGRRHPGADHGAARAAGARLLLGAGRPPQRDQRAGRPLPRQRPEQQRGRLARPGQRQDGHRVRPAARRAGRRRVQAAAVATTPWSSTGSSATCTTGTSSCSTTRSPPPARSSSCSASSASDGVREISLACTHGLFTGPAIERLKQEPDIAEIVATNTVPLPPEKRLPNMVSRLGGPAVRRGGAPDPRSASRSPACSATRRPTADRPLARRLGSRLGVGAGLMVAYCGSLPSTTGTSTVTSPALAKVSVMLAVSPAARSALLTVIGARSVSTICAPVGDRSRCWSG